MAVVQGGEKSRGGVARRHSISLFSRAEGGNTPFRSKLSLRESYGRRMSGWGGPNVA